jgi:hypothetical protein
MLVKLLNLLAVGGVFPVSVLARDLGVSEALLQEMISDLVRLGYLRSLIAACQSGCAACSLANSCAMGGVARVWALTQKGIRLIGGGNDHTGRVPEFINSVW